MGTAALRSLRQHTILSLVFLPHRSAEVPFSSVGLDHHNPLMLVLRPLSNLQPRVNGCSGGNAAENAFVLRQLLDNFIRLGFGNGDNFIDQINPQHIQNKSGSNALQVVFPSQLTAQHFD